MDRDGFDPKIHTSIYFDTLSKEWNGNKTKMAKDIGITREKLYRWMKKAKKVPNTTIATLNELYAFIQTMPDHIDYDWFIKHMNLPRKHYHSAMKKILDLAREYQSTL